MGSRQHASLCLTQKPTYLITNHFHARFKKVARTSTHSYYASRRAKRHAQMGRTAQVSGVARLVGVQWTVQNIGNVKGEPKYLNCEAICNTYFLLLNYFLYCCRSLGFYGGPNSLLFVLTSSCNTRIWYPARAWAQIDIPSVTSYRHS